MLLKVYVVSNSYENIHAKSFYARKTCVLPQKTCVLPQVLLL